MEEPQELKEWMTLHPYGSEGCRCQIKVWHWCAKHGHKKKSEYPVMPTFEEMEVDDQKRQEHWKAIGYKWTPYSHPPPDQEPLCSCGIDVHFCPWHNPNITTKHGAIWYG